MTRKTDYFKVQYINRAGFPNESIFTKGNLSILRSDPEVKLVSIIPLKDKKGSPLIGGYAWDETRGMYVL